MTTAKEIIGKSLRSIGVIASGDAATAAEYVDCLYALNSIIDGISAGPGYYYTTHDEQFTLSNKAAYCIGNDSVPLASLTSSGTTATATTIIPHGLITGNKITVLGATESAYNVTSEITVVTPYKFTYAVTSTTSPATGAPAITAGDFATNRPIRCVGAYVDTGGVLSPMAIITESYWTNVIDKTETGSTPNRLLYRPNYPFGQFLVSPAPSGASILHLRLEKTIEKFSSIDQQRQLPPGYQRMLEIMLAVEVAPEFGGRVNEMSIAVMKDTLALIVDQNKRELINSSNGANGNGNGS